MAPNQTVSIGKLTFTHRYFMDTDICFGDVPMPVGSMAGFTVRWRRRARAGCLVGSMHRW